MQKIVAIFLVSLLGFLGCSDSDDGTTTVGKAIPVAPFGIIETPTPTYEWTPVPGATKYRLVVQDTNEVSTIQDAQETAIIDEWYTAEEAGCVSEDGLCMATPETEVLEKNTWKVQACANQESGLWSETLHFDSTALNAPRYTDNGDATVTDNYKHLMWTQNMTQTGGNWNHAVTYCKGLKLADHNDWRLPYLSELRSLQPQQIPFQYPPTILGPPFKHVSRDDYWSATDYTHNHVDSGKVAWACSLVADYPPDKRVKSWEDCFVSCVRELDN